jgi:uncharacterized membrane protein
MTYGKKIAFLTLLAATILLAESPVFAATINVRNSVDRKLSLAFYYTDASGNEVTKGWWHVEAGEETTVTLNADASKPIYYGAFNKDLYADSSTIKGSQVRGWLSYAKFTFDADVEPSETGAFESRFFKVPESGTVNVDGDPFGK